MIFIGLRIWIQTKLHKHLKRRRTKPQNFRKERGLTQTNKTERCTLKNWFFNPPKNKRTP